MPKSTYVTLAHKRKQKFFYFGCSLVRRFYCKINKNNNGTDGQTDRQTDGQSATQYAAPLREEGRILIVVAAAVVAAVAYVAVAVVVLCCLEHISKLFLKNKTIFRHLRSAKMTCSARW